LWDSFSVACLPPGHNVTSEKVTSVGAIYSGVSGDFAELENGRFIYYMKDLLVQLDENTTDGRSAVRYDLRNGSEAALPNMGDFRRYQGKMLSTTRSNLMIGYIIGYGPNPYGVFGIQVIVPQLSTGYNVLNRHLPVQNHQVYRENTLVMTVSRQVDKKRYELSDHLGNVTVVFSDLKGADISSGLENYLTVENYYNYYPFGMMMPGRLGNGSEGYRYGFNGKEKDGEWNSGGAIYDYGFRIYDPRIAKFLSVDPLTRQYPELTPYQFASNTPIMFIDIDGLEGGFPVGNGQMMPMLKNDKAEVVIDRAKETQKQINKQEDPKTQNEISRPDLSSSEGGSRFNGNAPFSVYNGLVRLSYATEVRSLGPKYGYNPPGAPNLAGNQARYDLKLKYRKFVIPGTEGVLDLVEPLVQKTERVSYWKTRTNVTAMGATGVVLGGYGLYQSYLHIKHAPNGDKAVGEEASGWAGAWAGTQIAAGPAASTGNAFTALGIMTLGGITGGIFGKEAAKMIMDSGTKGPYLPTQETSNGIAPRDNTNVGGGTGF